MDKYRLIVAGSRTFTNYEYLTTTFMDIAENLLKDKAVSIVSGCARGADALAIQLANTHHIKCHKFPAQWDKHGKAAGYIRNKEMAEFADGLLAFWDGKSPGTKHMIDTMFSLNKKCFIHIID